MRARLGGVCRGDGNLYAKVTVAPAPKEGALAARAFVEGVEVPCGAYPLEDGAGDGVRAWALVLPVADAPAIDVRLSSADGETSLRIGFARAKWESRLNYRVRPSLCAQLRDIEQRHLDGRYQLRVLRFLEGDDCIVWRLQAAWRGPVDARPAIEVTDDRGAPLDFELLPFEEQLPEGDEGECRLIYSLRLPVDRRFFLVRARDPHGVLTEGFCSMNAHAYEGFKYATWKMMRDARADDANYRRWLKGHRATPDQLREQRAAGPGDGPLISIVVPCYRSDAAYLREMIASVTAQSYERWELVLVDASAGESPVVADEARRADDVRVRVVALDANRGIAGNTNAGIEAARGEFVAFLDHDDVLEPDALHCYARAVCEQEGVDLVFCDEDLFEQPGVFMQPAFKTRLNLDLLYSHNCVTHFLMVRRAAALAAGLSPDEVSGAQDYDLTLRVLEQGGGAVHVPRVLYHWRVHPGSTSGDNADSKPYAQTAGRLALQAHLDRRGVRAVAEETEHAFVYRVRYALPDPAPLVSVVIPSKDHVSELDACVRSLLERATYTNLELVIVENNSADAATFAYYDELQARDERVRVVRWEGPFNYSAIMNFGVAQARGAYLLLLNNDTELITPDALEEMAGYLQRPEVGVVGAKLYFRDGLTQHAGMLVGPHGAVAHVNQDFPPLREGYLARAVRPGNFSGVTGACQMVRRAVFEELGGYDEAFAVGFNDIDFCLRALDAGYLVTFTPYAELFHYEFTTRGREVADEAKLRRWEDERARFEERWASVFEEGDPYTNPNLDRDSAYYALPVVG
ncbi:MAG: glycosyltransferase [Eggerthellaceae bacterium]|nr:glycosyltransferase [Eggerthellaceae bacterium]